MNLYVYFLLFVEYYFKTNSLSPIFISYIKHFTIVSLFENFSQFIHNNELIHVYLCIWIFFSLFLLNIFRKIRCCLFRFRSIYTQLAPQNENRKLMLSAFSTFTLIPANMFMNSYKNFTLFVLCSYSISCSFTLALNHALTFWLRSFCVCLCVCLRVDCVCLLLLLLLL